MGNFANRIKKMFNPKSSVPVMTKDEIGHNSYFLRLADNPDFYIHYMGEKNKDEVEYKPVKGVEGAAIWTWEKAWAFIRESGVSNLDMIRVDQVLKPENQKQ